MRIISSVLHIADAISEWVGKIASFIIILMIGIIVWNVVMRYGFSSVAAWEHISTCGKLLVVYVILGAAYTFRAGEHVNVDVLYSRFPLRTRAIVDLAIYTLFFLFAGAMLLKSVDGGLKLHLSLKSFLPPYWPVSLLVPIGLALLLLQGLAKFVRDILVAITGKEAA